MVALSSLTVVVEITMKTIKNISIKLAVAPPASFGNTTGISWGMTETGPGLQRDLDNHVPGSYRHMLGSDDLYVRYRRFKLGARSKLLADGRTRVRPIHRHTATLSCFPH